MCESVCVHVITKALNQPRCALTRTSVSSMVWYPQITMPLRSCIISWPNAGMVVGIATVDIAHPTSPDVDKVPESSNSLSCQQAAAVGAQRG